MDLARSTVVVAVCRLNCAVGNVVGVGSVTAQRAKVHGTQGRKNDIRHLLEHALCGECERLPHGRCCLIINTMSEAIK